MNDLENTKFAAKDDAGEEIYIAAWRAISQARFDGQKSGKHSPESWQEETVHEQAEHASIHSYEFLSMFQEPDQYPFNIQEAEHALCRLAIAIALYKRGQNADK